MAGRRHPLHLLLSFLAAIGVAVIGAAAPARAAYDQTVIQEIVSSYDGDNGQQYVEMQMLAGGQTGVAHTVFAIFDTAGAYVADLLVVPADVANGGAGVTWIAASADFQSERGFTADFTIPRNLPLTGGMICWGGGGGAVPANPPTWSRTNFANYVDCLAYGNYGGAANALTGTPTTRAPLDHALTRVGTTNDNATDFSCSDTFTPTNNAGGSITITGFIPCACGDGFAGGDEDCDDGNQVEGDCCSSACDFEAYGSACATDGIECTDDICNGAAACIHPPSSPFTSCTTDGIECTDDLCDGAGACAHAPSPPTTPCTPDANVCTDDLCDGAGACGHVDNTAPCDDANPCTEVDTCAAGACVGDPAPRIFCAPPLAAGKSILLVKNNSDDAKDQIKWTWSNGPAALVGDLGNPVTSTDYALCVYDQSGPLGAPAIRWRGDLAHGGTCGTKPCWTAKPKGFAYTDKAGSSDGLQSVKLQAGDAGKSKASAAGKGALLGVPALPFTGAVTVQLSGAGGVCWSATYSTPLPQRDPTAQYKAKSD